ncbi:MAG TPA: sodium:proton antiporter NhaD [Cyclobacteriaceae bacterium]|nr:sodium:proton antiporter NhaD [Cyclobacteriaceae bacterium]
MELYAIIIFVIGYFLIALEHPVGINKTATALVTGVLCWTLYAFEAPSDIIKPELSHHLSEISGILFFLMGAMTIVELVDAHQGFGFITNLIKTSDIRKLLWIVCWVAFFLSAVLDNLTTAIVMVSLTRKLVADRDQRLFFAGMIIIAANAGGAWSPIGDVTTTMLWIGGQISTAEIIRQTFIPSIVCLLAPLIYLSFKMKGHLEVPVATAGAEETSTKGSKMMLLVGVGALVFVPVFKTVTHLPPYMGMLLGLGVMWVVSELINPDADTMERKKLSAAHALSRIDVSSMLFFMGILLAVGSLQSMGTLRHFAGLLGETLGDNRIIISLIGVVSAIVDNVPLVAACMGMYSLEVYPMDHMLWEYLAYCAGTGGSLLVIGSAAGVAVMGMEKLEFIWYVKNISFLALIGYAGGAIVFLLMNS